MQNSIRLKNEFVLRKAVGKQSGKEYSYLESPCIDTRIFMDRGCCYPQTLKYDVKFHGEVSIMVSTRQDGTVSLSAYGIQLPG